MVNPDRPWPRPETPRKPLDATDNATLELWAAQPEFDTRSLEEFAAEGGRPVGPPNRLEREPMHPFVAAFAFAWGVPYLAWRAFRWALEILDFRRSAIDHALEAPPLPRFIPAPCPPSTPIRREDRRALRDELPPTYPDLDDDAPVLPRAPKGGTGETDRHGRRIPPRPAPPSAPPPKNFETGHLRSSFVDDPTLGPDQVLRINVGRRSSAGGGWPT